MTSPAEMYDPVNHPPHYESGGLEAIDVIEAFAAGNYHRGNALKYLLRADKKGQTAEDLQKAVWYIQRELERITPFEIKRSDCQNETPRSLEQLRSRGIPPGNY